MEQEHPWWWRVRQYRSLLQDHLGTECLDGLGHHCVTYTDRHQSQDNAHS